MAVSYLPTNHVHILNNLLSRFPMDSEYKGKKTLADMALESFGLQTPLIQFHEIPSRCPSIPSEEPKSEIDAEGLKDAFGNLDFAAFSEKFDELTMTTKHPHITTWYALLVPLFLIGILTETLTVKVPAPHYWRNTYHES
jgi:hypothetical protein